MDMAVNKITEKAVAEAVKSGAYALITQTETVNGAETEALRRYPLRRAVEEASPYVSLLAAERGGYGADWTGRSYQCDYVKNWPVMTVRAASSSTGSYRYVGFLNDTFTVILQPTWNESKAALTNPNLILRAGRTYLARARFLSGTVRELAGRTSIPALSLFFVYYDPASGTSYREYMANVPVPAEEAVALSGAETMSVAVTPTADVQYGFVFQDAGSRVYDDVKMSFEIKDITDLITTPTNGAKAENNIPAGRYFMVGSGLYYATRAITAGSDIVPGTNCRSVSVAEALNTIINQ